MFVLLTTLIVASIVVLAFSFLAPSFVLGADEGPRLQAPKTFYVLERREIVE